MKTQKGQGVATCRGKPRFTLRSRKSKSAVIQGKLRIRSMPGAFLVLGVIVVVVGTALAMAGYWPYRISSIQGTAEGKSIPESHTSRWSLGAKGLLSTAGLIHSERMKLLGPVIMGVGLFILICANTVLYENRDRETQVLLTQMRSVICSVSTTVPKEMATANLVAKHYQWVSSLPAAHLNILCLQQLASSEPLLQTTQSRDQEDSVLGIYQLAVLQAEAVHHHESEPLPSLHSSRSNSCDSSQVDLNTKSHAEHGGDVGSRSHRPQLNKLNSCFVSASSMSTLGLDKMDVPAAQTRRCHSMTYRTKQYISQTFMCVEDGFPQPRETHDDHLIMTRREGNSQVCVSIPGQIVEDAVEQAHRSWPQLDLGSGRRYLKLENKEDSVDTLQDQLEQQCFHHNKGFGSGPFQ